MKPVEKMAEELFNSFCLMEGKSGDWRYLSTARKKAWMKDVLLIARYFAIQLQKEVKPLPPTRAQASFEIGFNTGQISERTNFIALVEKINDQLEDEYDNLSGE